MRGAPDKLHAKFPHVYAIVRFDSYGSGKDAATVVKVISSEDLAQKEASRLNEVNKGKKCFYEVQITRFVQSSES